jgi:tetratricopeptide (TPR) repeat protein
VAFHRGEYAAAVGHVDALKARGIDLAELDRFTPYAPTLEASRGMVEVTAEGVRVRVAEGVDRVLAEDALDTVRRCRSTIDPLLGGGPAHPIVLDIYPSATRFILASGLPPEAVRTTNVIALSKWSRLLLTSPRAMGRGYGWKDTVAHEYIHLVVALRTGNAAPVWLQEGLAKHLETRWRGDRAGGLGPHAESLLAKALGSGGFVPFEKFERSMAYLDSGEEAALAFAQVETMIRHFLSRAGDDALPALMDRVRAGEDPGSALASLAGYPGFPAFQDGWRAWLRTLPLVQQELAALPVTLDGAASEAESDPLLSGRPDLQRFLRVGDLLREKGRCDAALVEYARAEDPAGPPSPVLAARRGACLHATGKASEALAVLTEAARLYPDFALLQVERGRVLDALGRPADAVVAWSAAHDVNPYDPEVQDALVRNYQKLGRADDARRHLRYARILATGGAGG